MKFKSPASRQSKTRKLDMFIVCVSVVTFGICSKTYQNLYNILSLLMENLIGGYLSVVKLIDVDVMASSEKFNKIIINAEKKTARLSRRKYLSLTKAADKRLIQNRITSLDPNNWWESFVRQRYPDEKCFDAFKCSRESYLYLIKVLRPYISPKQGATQIHNSLNLLKGVSVEKQVALMLHKLAYCTEYGIMSTMFGVHKSTTHKMFYKAITGLNKYILHKEIKMPDSREAVEISGYFEERTRIPQILGVLDYTHIPCVPCPTMIKEFTNTEKYASFVLQTIVDSNLCFRDISIRHCGGRKSSLVLQDSHIYKYRDKVLPSETRKIDGIEVPYKIAGAIIYPLLPWLISGYVSPTTASEVDFNNQMEEILSYSKQAIARLRGRFAFLSQTMDVSFRYAPAIIAACCAIHNICEKNEDLFYAQWLDESNELIKEFRQPEKVLDLTIIPRQEDCNHRAALKENLTRSLLLETNAFEG